MTLVFLFRPLLILQISEEQKLHVENIVSSEEKCNKEKYILCVNLLSS